MVVSGHSWSQTSKSRGSQTKLLWDWPKHKPWGHNKRHSPGTHPLLESSDPFKVGDLRTGSRSKVSCVNVLIGSDVKVIERLTSQLYTRRLHMMRGVIND